MLSFQSVNTTNKYQIFIKYLFQTNLREMTNTSQSLENFTNLPMDIYKLIKYYVENIY